jgi:uncharacterized protein
MGGMEHRGSLLILPDGMFHWPVVDFAGVTVESLAPVLRRGAALSFLLLGTGATQVFPDRGLREAFAKAGLGLEPMDTGAACRTYNVLLPEARVFAAALIALPG